jgi:iron-sulfur cluster assembly accessory protein
METDSKSDAVVTVTPSAAGELRAMMENPENRGKLLRVYVEQGGCSGMQYSMVFDEKRPDDIETTAGDVAVLVDPFSAQYIHGAVLDFSQELTGGGFKISNPNARQSCGCGKSFQT